MKSWLNPQKNACSDIGWPVFLETGALHRGIGHLAIPVIWGVVTGKGQGKLALLNPEGIQVFEIALRVKRRTAADNHQNGIRLVDVGLGRIYS